MRKKLRFPQLPDASPEPILITDEYANIIYVNSAWEKLTGYTRKEVLGKNPRILNSGKTPKRIYTRLWKKLKNGKAFTTDGVIDKHKNGKLYQVYSTFFPIKENGKVIYYVQMQYDITKNKVLEKKLQENEEQMRIILNNTDNYAIYLLDKKGLVRSWNAGAERVNGYTAEEIIGKSFLLFYTEQDRKKHKPEKNLEKAVQRGRFEEDGIRVRKNGTMFWANIVIIPLKSKRGIVEGFVKVVRDITERKQIEEELKFHDQILIDMAEGVSLVQASNGKFVFTNPAFEKMFGYDNHELLGKPVAMINAQTDKSPEETVKEIVTSLRQKGVWSGEILNKRKNGKTFYCQVNISSFVHHEYGDVWISVQQDITERKLLEQQKNSFIGVASHELKTPITSLSAYTQMLHKRLEKKGTKEEQYFLQNITMQTNRLLNLVDDLLHVSRIDSERMELHLKQFNLCELINKIVADFQYTIDSHTITIVDNTSAVVFGDENRIEQVVINLLTNAIKYSPQADKVLVHITKDAQTAVVGVQDFGLGIANEDQPHVFERFYRTKDKQEGKIQGFGLGLYICSEIIKRHKGKIWVESEKGKGSTFYFRMPLAA